MTESATVQPTPREQEQREKDNIEFIDQLVLDVANMLKRVCEVGAVENTITIPIKADGSPYTIHIAVRQA